MFLRSYQKVVNLRSYAFWLPINYILSVLRLQPNNNINVQKTVSYLHLVLLSTPTWSSRSSAWDGQRLEWPWRQLSWTLALCWRASHPAPPCPKWRAASRKMLSPRSRLEINSRPNIQHCGSIYNRHFASVKQHIQF